MSVVDVHLLIIFVSSMHSLSTNDLHRSFEDPASSSISNRYRVLFFFPVNERPVVCSELLVVTGLLFCLTFGRVLSFPSQVVVDGVWNMCPIKRLIR